MKIVTWNVAGLRAVLAKNKAGKRDTDDPNAIAALIKEHEPDIIAIQESKCPENLNTNLDYSFQKILASQTRKGYAGVAVFSKIQPISVLDDFPHEHNKEGRVISLEFKTCYLINAYVPNSKGDLSRLEYRTAKWEAAMREYINKLQEMKPVIYLADLNVAPTEMDIYTTKGHKRAAGFTIEERTEYDKMMKDCKLIDTYRHLYPEKREYTYFSNFAKSRERGAGWRIDMALVSRKLKKYVKDVTILKDYYGSDHVPVLLELSEMI
jgi:exodeoxyribonuclease III